MAQDAKIIKDSLPKELKESFGNDTFADLTPQEKLSLILATVQRIGPSGPKMYTGLTSFLFRTHHKLLLIDGKCFITGGRNLSDEYHSSRGDSLIDGNAEIGIEPRHYPFQDIDVSSCLENKMDYSESFLTQSFERLWKHSLNVNLHTNFTAPELDINNITKIEELHRKAKMAEHLLKNTQSSLILEQSGGLNAQYVENIMTPTSIINSSITDLYTNLFKSLDEGDEASFVNAYFYLDPKLFTGHQEKDSKMKLLYTSLIEAAQRKAKLSIHTNSITTTDLSIVNILSYPFYRKFVSENIQIKELYKGSDLDQGSLHKKAAYFSRPKKGDVLIVGSYNLDARSHYKDTNVALSIEIPNNLREEAFKAFNRYTSGSLKWSEVNESRLQEIDETVVKDKRKIKLRRFLYPFRNEI
jgi:phosphatidylserine/phosphatidylglycerophosphate/cardiolipin synthase-like enzyme